MFETLKMDEIDVKMEAQKEERSNYSDEKEGI